MQYKKEHEPELKDMDDYHKPIPTKKLRIIVWSFIALGVIWVILKELTGLF